MQIASKNASTLNDVTPSLSLLEGQRMSISVIGTGFTGTVKLQRSFEPKDVDAGWRDVDSWTASKETDITAVTAAKYRLLLSAVSGGTVLMELRAAGIVGAF